MYYVTDSHPGIIPPEVFDVVQAEIAKNRALGKARSGGSCFADRIVCAACGQHYGPKIWNSSTKYRKTVWQCNGKYKAKGGSACASPHFDEDALKDMWVQAINGILRK
ncbi:MAG: recombinase family protein, partial [Oscillospiraceae bacterium]|nr:recombinase family protein [Oscillospiraceae bacterium]